MSFAKLFRDKIIRPHFLHCEICNVKREVDISAIGNGYTKIIFSHCEHVLHSHGNDSFYTTRGSSERIHAPLTE